MLTCLPQSSARCGIRSYQVVVNSGSEPFEHLDTRSMQRRPDATPLRNVTSRCSMLRGHTKIFPARHTLNHLLCQTSLGYRSLWKTIWFCGHHPGPQSVDILSWRFLSHWEFHVFEKVSNQRRRICISCSDNQNVARRLRTLAEVDRTKKRTRVRLEAPKLYIW